MPTHAPSATHDTQTAPLARQHMPEVAVQDDVQLAQMQAFADHSPATQRLHAIQRAASDRRRPARQPDAPRVAQRQRTNALRNSSTLQNGPAPNVDVQRPALIGATNTPVQTAELDRIGIAATTMSDADYAQWQGTVQCKLGVHGVHSHEGRTTVTQFKTDGPIAQRLPLSDRTKKWLLGTEAVLSIVAGSVALGVAIPTGIVPAMIAASMSIGIGLLKLARVYLMNKSEAADAAGKAKAKKWMDIIRGIEAVLAGIGAAMVLTDPKALASGIALAVFALAKLVRSIATAIAGDKKQGVAAKIASVAHVVETAALAFAGGFTLGVGSVAESAPKIGAGVSMIAVAGSKALRSGDQAAGALLPAPQAAGPQPANGNGNGNGAIPAPPVLANAGGQPAPQVAAPQPVAADQNDVVPAPQEDAQDLVRDDAIPDMDREEQGKQEQGAFIPLKAPQPEAEAQKQQAETAEPAVEQLPEPPQEANAAIAAAATEVPIETSAN